MIDFPIDRAAARITALLAATENRTLDFKRISAKHGRMIETICAFANTDGGLVVIGVGDAKDLKPGAKPESRLFGVEENPEAFDLFYRQVLQRFDPPLARLHWLRVPCTLQNGQPGHVVMLRVDKSEQVHSVVGDGTWTRMDASNRELTAAEIADLAYQRGVRSAASELVPVNLGLLDTPTWAHVCGRARFKNRHGSRAIATHWLGRCRERRAAAHAGGGAAVCRRAGQLAGGAWLAGRHSADGVQRQNGCGGRGAQYAQNSIDDSWPADCAD
jgi:predicted HTH transcriptional regulator